MHENDRKVREEKGQYRNSPILQAMKGTCVNAGMVALQRKSRKRLMYVSPEISGLPKQT